MPDLPFQILKMDLVDSANVWVIQLHRRDGRRCQAQIRPESFHAVRQHPMGQFLLLSWFSRAPVLSEDQPSPR